MDVRVADHFHRSEFACPCGCGFAAADVELLGVLERLRLLYDQPLHITSGCRCARYNDAVGGAVHSFHLKGLAADFQIRGEDPAAISDILDGMYPDRYGIGSYPSWVHIDMRQGTPARWGG